MSVSSVIAKMTSIEERLRELASDVENLQLSFDGQSTPNAPPKLENLLPSNFVGAILTHEDYVLQLIGHLQGKLNFLGNSLYPNSKGQALSNEAAKAMAEKLAPRNAATTVRDDLNEFAKKIGATDLLVDNNGKHL